MVAIKMKNIQVIDGAANCVYPIYSTKERDFLLIFPDGHDIEFIDDFVGRVGPRRARAILERLWRVRLKKADVNGIHGTLFYELEFKKKYYPNRMEEDAENQHLWL